MDKVVIKLLKQAEFLPVRANAVLVIHVYQATRRKVCRCQSRHYFQQLTVVNPLCMYVYI